MIDVLALALTTGLFAGPLFLSAIPSRFRDIYFFVLASLSISLAIFLILPSNRSEMQRHIDRAHAAGIHDSVNVEIRDGVCRRAPYTHVVVCRLL